MDKELAAGMEKVTQIHGILGVYDKNPQSDYGNINDIVLKAFRVLMIPSLTLHQWIAEQHSYVESLGNENAALSHLVEKAVRDIMLAGSVRFSVQAEDVLERCRRSPVDLGLSKAALKGYVRGMFAVATYFHKQNGYADFSFLQLLAENAFLIDFLVDSDTTRCDEVDEYVRQLRNENDGKAILQICRSYEAYCSAKETENKVLIEYVEEQQKKGESAANTEDLCTYRVFIYSSLHSAVWETYPESCRAEILFTFANAQI